jgi:large conductance mechanosensitive channel
MSMKKFIGEFGKFIKKGNVLDLAVAVIIGGAFGKIVASLVKDIITPIIGLIMGRGKSFENLKIIIEPAQFDTLGNIIQAEHAITYGLFIQNILDFLIIALTVFTIVYLIGKAKTKAEELATLKAKQDQEEALASVEVLKVEPTTIQEQKPSVEDLLQDIKVLLEQNFKK